jgi:pimeloyl-ACP methyl ester carboxylesterase
MAAITSRVGDAKALNAIPAEQIRIPASGGLRLGGWFFRGGDGRRACVVMAHGFGGSGVHTLEPFARRFQAAGVHVIAFDYRGFGASEGEPRQIVSPRAQLEDWESAITYARERADVDRGAIALWGVSYGGGSAVIAAARDGQVAAVMALVPMMDTVCLARDIRKREGWGWMGRITLCAAADLLRGAIGAAPLRVRVVGPPGSLASITSPGAEAGYLATVGPDWINAVGARIFLTGWSFRPVNHAARLPCPLLLQIGEHDCVVPIDAAERAGGLAGAKATVVRYPLDHFDVFGGAGFEATVHDEVAFLRQQFETRGHALSADVPAPADSGSIRVATRSER